MVPTDRGIPKQDDRRGMLVSEWLPQAYDGGYVAFRQLPQGTLFLCFGANDNLHGCRGPARNHNHAGHIGAQPSTRQCRGRHTSTYFYEQPTQPFGLAG